MRPGTTRQDEQDRQDDSGPILCIPLILSNTEQCHPLARGCSRKRPAGLNRGPREPRERNCRLNTALLCVPCVPCGFSVETARLMPAGFAPMRAPHSVFRLRTSVFRVQRFRVPRPAPPASPPPARPGSPPGPAPCWRPASGARTASPSLASWHLGAPPSASRFGATSAPAANVAGSHARNNRPRTPPP